MADYVTKIRTANGDKQIDYNALANKPAIPPTSGAVSTILSSNLTANRALISNSNGKVMVSGVSSTELGYLDGVTSAIQTQLNAKFPASGGTVTGQTKFTSGTASSSKTTGAVVVTGGVGVSGSIYGNAVYGAVYNDYAEYRQTTDVIEAGRVVVENGDDTLSLSSERLQPGAAVVSDTFGFAIGETDECKTPIAVSGRVLVYPYEDRNAYQAGDAVCTAPNGTVSKMTREEIKEYPERIIGTVSAIPTYETWGSDNVAVNGRIWIKVK